MLKCYSCNQCSTDRCSLYSRPVVSNFNGCLNHSSSKVSNPFKMLTNEQLKAESYARYKEEQKWN